MEECSKNFSVDFEVESGQARQLIEEPLNFNVKVKVGEYDCDGVVGRQIREDLVRANAGFKDLLIF